MKSGLLSEIQKGPAQSFGWPWTEEIDPGMYSIHDQWPRISIITPSLNQGQYIEETIRSVILQNYPNLEYIIIDGGSTDNTVEIIKKYENQISYWVSEPDQGQSDAINKGIAKASGEIFNWINSDDLLEKNALFHISSAFIEHSNAEVVFGLESDFWMDGSGRVDIHKTTLCKTLEETLYKGHIVQSPTYFNMGVVKQLGFLQTELHFLMDAEYWMRFVFTHGISRIRYIPNKITRFRIHDLAKTSQCGSEFGRERRILMASLAKTAGMREEDIQLITGQDMTGNCYFEGLKPASAFRWRFLKALFCRDLAVPFFNSGKTSKAKRAFLIWLTYGNPGMKEICSLKYLKIALLPGFLVRTYRLLKYGRKQTNNDR